MNTLLVLAVTALLLAVHAFPPPPTVPPMASPHPTGQGTGP